MRERGILEGDLEEALNTAAAIGDDRLQRQSMGRVVLRQLQFPTARASSATNWFKRGYDRGRQWPNAIHLMVCNGTGTGFSRGLLPAIAQRCPKPGSADAGLDERRGALTFCLSTGVAPLASSRSRRNPGARRRTVGLIGGNERLIRAVRLNAR